MPNVSPFVFYSERRVFKLILTSSSYRYPFTAVNLLDLNYHVNKEEIHIIAKDTSIIYESQRYNYYLL